MSKHRKMWMRVVMLPGITFFGEYMCVWSVPRILGPVAYALLWFTAPDGPPCSMMALLI